MTEDIITPKGYRFVTLWAVGLALFYVLVGYFGAPQLLAYKDRTAQNRKAWLETTTVYEAVRTNPGKAMEGKPAAVRVGIYVNRIGELAMHDMSWTADFDLWFRWTNKGISPGET